MSLGFYQTKVGHKKAAEDVGEALEEHGETVVHRGGGKLLKESRMTSKDRHEKGGAKEIDEKNAKRWVDKQKDKYGNKGYR